ncbi:MAG TPA: hypothetical protein VK675_03430 [Candidatus Paceibacterota bacterium]|nr:hypothetical protein [Candidatus Paceibacterota bacterium]
MINDQLVNYIRQQLSLSVSKEKITSDLKSQGWTDTEVSEAFSAIVPVAPASSPDSSMASPAIPNVIPMQQAQYASYFSNMTPHKSKKILTFIVILILLCSAGGGAYIYFNKKSTSPSSENISNSEGVETENNIVTPILPTSDTTPDNSVHTDATETPTLPVETPGQINDCKSITDPLNQFNCLKAEYLRTGNSTICDQSNDQDYRVGCYMTLAADKNSYPECKKINNTEEQVFCILVVAAENGDSATCDKFNGPDNFGEMCHHYIQNPNENIIVDIAYLGRGIETKNSSLCYKIKYSELRNSCLEGVKN